MWRNSYNYAKEMSRTQSAIKLKRNKPKPIANSQKQKDLVEDLKNITKAHLTEKNRSEIDKKERIRIGKSENRKKKMELQGFSKKNE